MKSLSARIVTIMKLQPDKMEDDMSTYFVDAGKGSNEAVGTNPFEPFRTITHAKDQAKEGDIVVVLDRPREDGVECAALNGKKWKKGTYQGFVPRTFHVRPDGDDGNDGSGDNPGAALATIREAVEMAREDDRICVPAGMLGGMISSELIERFDEGLEDSVAEGGEGADDDVPPPREESVVPSHAGVVSQHNDRKAFFIEDTVGRAPKKR